MDLPVGLKPTQFATGAAILLSGIIVAGTLLYSFDRFNVARQQHEWQLELTGEVEASVLGSLQSRTPEFEDNPDILCGVTTLRLYHESGNEYSGHVTYHYQVQRQDICRFANDGDCDEPNLCPLGSDTTDCRAVAESFGRDPHAMHPFTCEVAVTSDGRTNRWNLHGDECLLRQFDLIDEYCYGQ